MKERIKFTTRDAALKDGTLYNELFKGTKGTDMDAEDIFDKIVSIASIIKSFTKNVEIDVASLNDVFRGEAWFYMKNTTNEECFNNATAYKVLVNLIDPSIKVSAFLWPNDAIGTGDDVIDVNFFGYTLNTGNSEEQAKKEEQAMQQGRKLARSEAELWLNEAYERLKKEVNARESIDATGSYSGLLDVDDMERWSSDEDDDDIDLWSPDEDE